MVSKAASKGLYAKDTSVTPEQTLNDIRNELKRYGADKFMFFEEELRIGVAFEMQKRRVRFLVPLPTLAESSVRVDGTPKWSQQAKQAHAKNTRQRWRALYLVIDDGGMGRPANQDHLRWRQDAPFAAQRNVRSHR